MALECSSLFFPTNSGIETWQVHLHTVSHSYIEQVARESWKKKGSLEKFYEILLMALGYITKDIIH